MHADRTIGAEIRQLGGVQPFPQEINGKPAARRPPSITGAPVGHGIGMLAALLMPVRGRRPINLIDVWDPGRVLQAMLEDGSRPDKASTVFFTSLLDHPDFDPERHVPLMPVIGLGGAAVPAGSRRTRRAARYPDYEELREHRAPVDHRLLGGATVGEASRH